MPVDRKQLAGITVLRQKAGDAPAKLGDIAGGAEYGDRARMDDALQGQAGGCSFARDMRGVQNGRHSSLVYNLCGGEHEIRWRWRSE